MNNFTITGFADEIASDLVTQIKGLKENGISHIEVRGINGTNVSELTLDQALTYKQTLHENGIHVQSVLRLAKLVLKILLKTIWLCLNTF